MTAPAIPARPPRPATPARGSGWPATMRAQGWQAMFTQFAADWFHPNDRGHRVWADAFWQEISGDVQDLKRRPR